MHGISRNNPLPVPVPAYGGTILQGRFRRYEDTAPVKEEKRTIVRVLQTGQGKVRIVYPPAVGYFVAASTLNHRNPFTGLIFSFVNPASLHSPAH
jgi:hypothetical protein